MDGSEDADEKKTCKKCQMAFTVLNNHLRWKADCKAAYSEEEQAAEKRKLKAANGHTYLRVLPFF